MELKKLILVSGSPRRADLLSQLGLDFDVLVAGIDESICESETPEEYVKRVSYAKVADGFKKLAQKQQQDGRLLLGADTAVVADGRLIGKPKNKKDALDTLMLLSGDTHKVITAVVLQDGDDFLSCVVETLVTFRQLTVDEAELYWLTGEPLDKAGAYGIQGKGAIFVSSISGSYSNVVGLPLMEVSNLLRKVGVDCLD